MVKRNYGKGVCEFCGTEYERITATHKFCSDDCRINYYAEQRSQPQEQKCEWCGKVFIGNRKKRFCSKECCYQATLERRRFHKKKKSSDAISEVALKAREMGLTCGKYVSIYGV